MVLSSAILLAILILTGPAGICDYNTGEPGNLQILVEYKTA